MVTRLEIAALALVLAAGLAAPARAQVAAPRLVEDEESAEEAQPAPPPPRRSAAGPASAPHAGARATLPPVASPRAPADAPAAARAPAASSAATAQPSAAPAAAQPALPPPPPAPTNAADLARRIVPVSTTYARLMAHWAERRNAQRESDPTRADRAREALLGVRRELGIRNLVALAAAEVRDSRHALASNLASEAVSHAELAVELAPSFADGHVALARARLADGKGGPALAALRDAIAAGARDPYALRAFYGDVLGAALAAIFTAAIGTALLLVARRIRLFVHDFHHLPLLRGTAPVQAGFLALVLLGTPVAFGLGPFAVVAMAVLAVWLYLSTSERVVATAALAALLALPWAAGRVARLTAWTGTLAERVHQIEDGAVSDEEAAELAAHLADAPAPAPLYAALGRHHKRRGHLDEALRFYRLAAAADDRAPEIQVNVGNVLFLQGDLDGAKAAYLAATDRAGTDLVVLGAAHYDLSKLYLRTSDMEKSAAARERAEREAGEFLRENGSDDDFSANRYLVDVPVPARKIAALADADAAPEGIAAWIRRRVAGGLPASGWPWSAAGFVAFLWVLPLAAPRLAPARACGRCGGAACPRCDSGAGALCGQCVNVFTRKGVVDARDRLRKEAQVRRYEQFRQVATRILSIVGAGAGQVWSGAAGLGAALLTGVLFAGFLVWFWRGITPPPQPSPYVLLGKLAVAAPLGLALWALAIRDAFRRTR